MSNQTGSTNTTQNDRIMAALAHVSALLPLMGVIAPIVIWATQKDKSEYVAFQALQAIVYQLSMILAWFVGMGCYMFSFFATFLTLPFTGSAGGADPTGTPFFMIGFIIPFIVLGAMFVGGGLFIIYGVFAAVLTLQGREFRYLIIGNRLVNYLHKKTE